MKMRGMGLGNTRGTGSIGAIRGFVSVLREMSFDDVREEAETVPRLLVLATDEAMARSLCRSLVGFDAAGAMATGTLTDDAALRGGHDAVVVFDPHETGEARARIRRSLGSQVLPLVSFEGSGPEDDRAVDQLRTALLKQLPGRSTALGRAFPPFRPAAVKAVIDETAKANAQFALVSNIPSVVPIVGSLAAVGADFLVLTKNQILLMFKIAAIHGRDLHDQWGILQELVPVVGAGLLWRTLAREAASFIPLAAGTIPKVAIAYAGTMSTGRAADLYYRTNRRASREQLQGYYQQAIEGMRKLPFPLMSGKQDGRQEAVGDDRSPTPLPIASPPLRALELPPAAANINPEASRAGSGEGRH